MMQGTPDHDGLSGQREGARIAEIPGPPPIVQPPLSLERAKQVRRSYLRWLRLSRLATAAFVVTGAAALLWLLPWLPGGLDTEDYTPELAFTIYLLSGAAVTGILVAAFQELARRYRERIMVWAAVYDEESGLHSRDYLYDRLLLACEQAERLHTVFSVVVLRFRVAGQAPGRTPALTETVMERTADIIYRMTRLGDLVARLSDSELAILATTVDESTRRGLTLRIIAAVTADLGDLLGEGAVFDVVSGGATFGEDGRQAAALLSAARKAAMLAPRGSARAA